MALNQPTVPVTNSEEQIPTPPEPPKDIPPQNAARTSSLRQRIVYEDSVGSASNTEDTENIWNKLCSFFQKKKVGLLNYEVTPPSKKRSVHNLEFIHNQYYRLSENIASYNEGWVDAIQYDVTNAVMHGRRAIRFLHLINKFAEESLQQLSFYLEDDVPEDDIDLIESRCTVGSYMWLIATCLQAVLESSVLDQENLRQIFMDIVHTAAKNWLGIFQVIESFISVRKRTEYTVDKYIACHDTETKKIGGSKSTLRNKSNNPLDKKLQESRREKIEQLRLYNKVGHHNISWGAVPSTKSETNPNTKTIRASFSMSLMNFKVMKHEAAAAADHPLTNLHVQKTGSNWIEFESSEGLKDQAKEIMSLFAEVKRILEEIHVNIHVIQKYMTNYVDVEFSDDSTSYCEAITFLRRALRTLPQSDPEGLIPPEDRLVLVELGKILEDELELSEYFLMTLRSLIFEARHCVHVVYEFCRLYHHCEIPMYEIVANIKKQDVLKQFSRDEKSRSTRPSKTATTDEIPMNLHDAFQEFNASPYFEVLQVFPVTLLGVQYFLERKEPTPPSSVVDLIRKLSFRHRSVPRIPLVTSETTTESSGPPGKQLLNQWAPKRKSVAALTFPQSAIEKEEMMQVKRTSLGVKKRTMPSL